MLVLPMRLMHTAALPMVAGLLTSIAQDQPALAPAGSTPAAPVPAPALPASSLVVTNGVLTGQGTHNAPTTSLLGSAMTVQSVTLQQVVEMALQNNYSIQISRFDPDIADFNLRGSYGVYEPALQLGANHTFRSSPGRLDPDTFLRSPSSEVEVDSFSGALGPGVSGYLPTGLNYGVDVGLSRQQFNPGAGEQYSSELGLTMVQPILRDFWIDQSRATIQINKKRLKGSEWALRQQLVDTISQVEVVYYDLISARENIKVQQTALQYASQLLRENKMKVEFGALAPLDEKQAESEVARVRATLLQSEQSYALQLNNLKNLVTQDFANWTNIVLDPVETLVALPASTSLPESWNRGLTMRPDLMQLKYTLEEQDITLKFRKNQMWPALDLRGTYGQAGLEELPNRSYERALRALGSNENPRYSFGAVLTVPLGNRAARNSYKAAAATRQQFLLQYKQLEQAIMTEIDNAIRTVQSQYQQVEASRQARLYALDALSAEQKKYENGKSTSFLVLQAQRDLTQRKFEELSALANYNKAISDLASAEGATLDRFNLKLEVK